MSMNSVESVSIQPIDKTTVNKICSGQVVLNLATAVKELLENSIDAGANSIQVKLEEYGSDSIEVVDNGCGVEEVNFQALTLKHHTSKIAEFADLYSVETFGFRGEALSSLCALSDVTIITQHKNAVIGATLKFDHNGIITSNTKTLRKIGTTVRLENLFSTLPIRRTEFMKNLKREFNKMCNVLYAYGLQSVGVRITCTNHISKTKLTAKESQKEDENSKRSTNIMVMDTKGESIESNILSVFGLKQKQNLLKIKEITPTQDTLKDFGLENRKLDLEKFKLDGFISSCAHGCGRTSSDRQFYYVNSRPVDNSKVSKLVNDIYHQYNNHQDPFVVLNIKVAVGSFDMNVTPDKRQILLQNENLLFATLKESLHCLFRNIPSTLEVHNVGLIRNSLSESKGTTELPERLKMLKASLRNYASKSDKKEQNVSRIDRFLEFRKQETLQNKNFSTETKIKTADKTCNSNENEKEIVILVPKKENLEVSHKEETKTQNSFETKNEVSNEGLKMNETGNGDDALEEVRQECKQIKVELTNVEVTMMETKEDAVSEHKRKFLSRENAVSNLTKVEETCEDSEENQSKRMKLDEGLTENEKSNRKTVMCNASISDIKNLWLKHNQECKEGNSNVEVKFLTEIKPQNNERAENELKKEIKKDDFKQMEIIGQFNLGFIISKLNSDIFIIDQHATDEKYNFENFKSNTVMQTQRLFNPEKLDLTVDKEELMVQHRQVFKKNGFDFAFDENGIPSKRISLTAIPMSKNYVFGKEDVDELLFFLENAPDAKSLRPSRFDAMFASRACRKSVMIGTPLNRQEMRKLVDHMGEIEHPWNCPHGRPTMRHLLNLNMIVSKE